MPDAVVWNPWVNKAATMADLELDGWKQFSMNWSSNLTYYFKFDTDFELDN